MRRRNINVNKGVLSTANPSASLVYHWEKDKPVAPGEFTMGFYYGLTSTEDLYDFIPLHKIDPQDNVISQAFGQQLYDAWGYAAMFANARAVEATIAAKYGRDMIPGWWGVYRALNKPVWEKIEWILEPMNLPPDVFEGLKNAPYISNGYNIITPQLVIDEVVKPNLPMLLDKYIADILTTLAEYFIVPLDPAWTKFFGYVDPQIVHYQAYGLAIGGVERGKSGVRPLDKAALSIGFDELTSVRTWPSNPIGEWGVRYSVLKATG